MITKEQYAFLSSLEKKVATWLMDKNIPFTVQEKMFGVAEAGSAVVDFVLSERNIVLRTMGSYWHSGAEAKARDLFGREQLVNKGYIVVDLWEEDLSDDKIQHTMELALEGVETIR